MSSAPPTETVGSYSTPTSETRIPLDPSLYVLDDEQRSFLKTQTGIEDDEALKDHIFAIQKKAYDYWSYPCIRAFTFIKITISKMKIWPNLLELGKTRENAIFLDLGCCFGNDARFLIQNGFPAQNVICSDLRPDFWIYSHELFKTTPETFPVVFLPGDLFSSSFVEPRSPVYDLSIAAEPLPRLATLTSLTPLQGRISAINISRVFHLFNEADQLQLAKQVATLLSPLSGSMIFGVHAGAATKGPRIPGHPMFCHCPESWIELWDGQVFEKGTVKVEAELRKSPSINPHFKMADDDSLYIWWSVIRV